MNTVDILKEIEKAANASVKKTLLKHGAREPFYGVKIEDLKKIQKKVKANHQEIALQLFDSGIGDAMYLAGLMADGAKMNRQQLQQWAKKANGQMMSEYSVPWVACENEAAMKLALEWIDSSTDNIACTGWHTLGNIAATTTDEKLDLAQFEKLLERVEKQIEKAPNRVRYCMNAFVIAIGSFVKPLNKKAIETGRKIGNVEVDMNGTSCKVPYAPDYIKKVMDKGFLGKKKKTVKC
jgi:3-methyladenine DNA glycosylase AlkD